jgi:flagellar biosynthetic protein FliR
MFDELREIGIETDVDFVLRVGGLILARMLGGALAIPFLGGQMIPGRLKFGIPLTFTVFLYPLIAPTVPDASVPELGFVFIFLVLKELFVGYTLGFLVSLPFYAVETAGSFMDTQRGTTFAQVLAPLLGGQTSLLAQFYLLLFIAIFLGIGGNHLVIAAIGESYRVLPILEWPALMHPTAPIVDEVIRHAGDIFKIGLMLSAPIVIALLVTDITLGVVNRTAPQIQVFWIGMPLKAAGGLVIVFFAIGFLAEIFVQYTVDTVVAVKRAIIMFAGGTGG